MLHINQRCHRHKRVNAKKLFLCNKLVCFTASKVSTVAYLGKKPTLLNGEFQWKAQV
jgi:hypothetical protein